MNETKPKEVRTTELKLRYGIWSLSFLCIVTFAVAYATRCFIGPHVQVWPGMVAATIAWMTHNVQIVTTVKEGR